MGKCMSASTAATGMRAPGSEEAVDPGKGRITGDTAIRLGHWFGVEPQFWMNLQSQFDLAAAEERIGRLLSGRRIARQVA